MISNRENPQNFKPPIGLRKGLDYIALEKPEGTRGRQGCSQWLFWRIFVHKIFETKFKVPTSKKSEKIKALMICQF